MTDLCLVFTLRKIVLSRVVNNMEHQVVKVVNIVPRRMTNAVKRG
jgi:hypothetical protein